MARLVDADVLEKKLHELALDEWNQGTSTSWSNAYLECEDMVYNAPTVSQHVESVGEDGSALKHGHWVEVQRIHETDHTAICECSLCGDTVWVYDGQRAWNYCPRCGAKMDEVAT